MGDTEVPRPSRGKALLFFFAWFAIWGLVSFGVSIFVALVSIGGVPRPGVESPADRLSLCYGVAHLVLVLLPFGGIPAAARIAAGRSWSEFALGALFVCVLLLATLLWAISNNDVCPRY